MGQKGYISEFINGGRIVSHGKILSLESGFKLPNETPFSIYIRPKEVYSSGKMDVLLNVRCYQDEAVSEAPVVLNDWTPMAIVEIAPGNEILEMCDLYWGSGSYVEGV